MKLQSSIIRDTIELTDSQGQVLKSIPFVVNAAAVHDAAMALRIELDRTDSSNLEEFKRLARQLFTVIFGEAVVRELDEYYSGDVLSMVVDLSPLLINDIYPHFNRIRAQMITQRKKMKRG